MPKKLLPNWKEIHHLASLLEPKLLHRHIEKVFIPSRDGFPGGFIKNEWALTLSGREEGGVLIFSLRAQNPYLYWTSRGSVPAARKATQSGFGLQVSRLLEGKKISGFHALSEERIVVLDLEGDKREKGLKLILALIPAQPNAWVLIDNQKVLAQFKGEQKVFRLPGGALLPVEVRIREEFPCSLQEYGERVEQDLKGEVLSGRAESLQRYFSEELRKAKKSLNEMEKATQQASRGAGWSHYGELMKAHYREGVKYNTKEIRLLNYSTGEEEPIPYDPRKSFREQMLSFFEKAKRTERKIFENKKRLDDVRARIRELEQAAENLAAAVVEQDLKKICEQEAGWRATKAGKGARIKEATGKSFSSRDGFLIRVGRSQDENIELSMRQARGRDLWFHVRSRPGAHVVVSMEKGKSVPLETLLDAATLAVYFSGGEKWGKTEVDYTLQKNLRPIRGSKELSYTGEKTLLVAPEPLRLKRLLNR